jgi:hypothetical protein
MMEHNQANVPNKNSIIMPCQVKTDDFREPIPLQYHSKKITDKKQINGKRYN